jgi:hypothetical protein
MMPNIKDVFLRLVLESDFFITGSSFLFNQNQNGFLRYYMEFYPPLWSSYRSRTKFGYFGYNILAGKLSLGLTTYLTSTSK